MMARDAVMAWMRGQYGTKPKFASKILSVKLIHEGPDCLIASYEEWQDGTPPITGRLTTVVFFKVCFVREL